MDKLALQWPGTIGGRVSLVQPGCDGVSAGAAPQAAGDVQEYRRATTPRHICIVTETYPPEVNGVSLTLSHLVRGLLNRGHEVSLVHPRQATPERRDRPCNFTDIVVRGLPIPCYRGLQFGLPAGALLRRVWTWRRPDAVYIATEGPLGWSAAGAARGLGIAALSGFHTNFHAYSRHYRLGWLRSLLLRYLRNFHNRTAGTLVASAELRLRLEELGFKNVSVLGRGVDNQLFAPERRSPALRHQWGLSPGDLAVLHVGRLAPEKNLHLAIDAYRAIARHTLARFILVGDGPIRGALHREHPDLLFAGQKTGAELAAYYASGDIFVFSSETETFGNVTLEAMASGLAVIAYDYAAARIHIRHGETGVLVPFGQSGAFVEAAAGLVCDRPAIDRIRLQARRHAACADWSRVVERFDRLLAGACATRGITTGDPANYAQIAETERV